MKIKKFENITESIYYTKEKLAENQKEHENILSLLTDYLELNQYILEEELEDGDTLTVVSYDIKNKISKIEIMYITSYGGDSSWYANLSTDEFEKLMCFLDSPESYKNSKKYNL